MGDHVIVGEANVSRVKQQKRVLIAGGGVAAVEIVMGLNALAPRLVDVELVSPDPDFTYRPLAVAEPFGLGEMTRFDLGKIAADHSAHHRYGALASVEPDEHAVVLADGRRLEYDLLAIAIGARPVDPFPGALTFGSAEQRRELSQLLEELGREGARTLVFAVPPGVVWALPLYELALLTAAFAARRGVEDMSLALVTPEDAPLGVFGRQASEGVRSLLENRGIEIHTGLYPVEARPGGLVVSPEGSVPADRVITLPRLVGPEIPGLPADGAGFLPVDRHCRVERQEDVYAAGDCTNIPVKQGGLAAQQADVVAHAIAADAGADVEVPEYRPVLRGLLLTGGSPRYLRAEITGGRGEASELDVEPLWWPPGKISGRWLGAYFATLAAAEPPPHGIAVEIDDLGQLLG
ncbi:MAG: FAD-dependent oxidoreductase [Thermoleophilaceae bacterium]|nr:FAD-dependent oxidoreductase [Thermoleophilaceae bacterium]